MVPRGVSTTANAYLTPVLREHLDGYSDTAKLSWMRLCMGGLYLLVAHGVDFFLMVWSGNLKSDARTQAMTRFTSSLYSTTQQLQLSRISYAGSKYLSTLN